MKIYSIIFTLFSLFSTYSLASEDRSLSFDNYPSDEEYEIGKDAQSRSEEEENNPLPKAKCVPLPEDKCNYEYDNHSLEDCIYILEEPGAQGWEANESPNKSQSNDKRLNTEALKKILRAEALEKMLRAILLEVFGSAPLPHS